MDAEIHEFWLHRWTAWLIDYKKTRKIPDYIQDQHYRRLFKSFDDLVDHGQRTVHGYALLPDILESMKNQYVKNAKAVSTAEIKKKRHDIAEQFTMLQRSLNTYSTKYQHYLWMSSEPPVFALHKRLLNAAEAFSSGNWEEADIFVLEFVRDHGQSVVSDLYTDCKALKTFVKTWSDAKFLVDPEQLTKAKNQYQSTLELLVSFRNYLVNAGVYVQLDDDPEVEPA